jgi:hypothetical protein
MHEDLMVESDNQVVRAVDSEPQLIAIVGEIYAIPKRDRLVCFIFIRHHSILVSLHLLSGSFSYDHFLS